jgi:type II secretory pathway pseudopilin PulG
MKSLLFILACVFPFSIGIAQEVITNLEGRVFSNATVIRVEPDGINIRHSGGITKMFFWELSTELQEQYGYDPQKAAAYNRQAAQAQEAYRKRLQSQPTELEQRAKAFESSRAPSPEAATQVQSEAPSSKSGPPPPFSNRIYSAADIFQNMFDLEGKVIRINFPSSNARQDSREYYSANYGSGARIAFVLIPAHVGRVWFKEKGASKRPPTLYVQVSTGKLVNEYGTEETGPILTAVGVSMHRDIRGTPSYRW